MTKDLHVYFIKEFFAATDEYSLTVPKGRIEKTDDAIATANKELQEEIGMKAKRLQKLAILTMSPGYLTQLTHVFLAEDLTESRLPGDELEPPEIITHPLAQFEQLIDQEKLKEARVIAALYLTRRKLLVRG